MASEGAPAAGVGEGDGRGGPGVRVRYCAVYTCLHNYKTHPHLTYFTIPTPLKRCIKWLKKIRRMDILKNGKVSGYHRVCEAHFRPEDVGLTATGRRKRLAPQALPALRLPQGNSFVTVHEPPPRAPPSPPGPPPDPLVPPPQSATAANHPRDRTLTASQLEVFQYIDNTPRRRAVKRPRPESEPRLRRRSAAPVASSAPLADFFAACDRHLDRDAAEFVKRIAQLKRRDGEGPDAGSHGLCVRLLVGSPAAYRLLAPALALPPPAALRRALHRLGHTRLPELLELRAERMTETERHCTVSLDIVDVRPHLYYNITLDRIIGLDEVDGVQEPWPARHCAVLSARALGGAWAQPVAACCLARPDARLLAWTDAALRQLLAAGLRVHALVVDPAGPAPRRPGVSATRPFFLVDQYKIYVVYDPPRLMRLLLCNFMKYDFHFERTVARWDDVVRYRELERPKPLTLTPRLTDALTGPAAPRRARALPPRRAARLLDRALAAALAGYGERGLLPESAPATVKLILKLNDLFDILDSPGTGAGRNHAGESTGDSAQTGFLTYMKSFFGGLKLKDRSGVERPESSEFAERWQVSVAAVLALRERAAPLRLRLRLAPRRLRLDGRVAAAARRAAPGRPTCRGILAAFKKRLFDDVLRSTDEEAPVDLNGFLVRANSIDASATVSRERFELEEEAEVRAGDYRRGWRRRGGVAGAAARLLRAVRRVHGACAAAAPYLAGAPRADLLRLLRRLDAALAAALRSPRQRAAGRLADLLLDVHVLECAGPCGCFPLQFLKKLFLRMRLHDILRQNQAAFKNGDDDEFRIETIE